MIGRGELGFVLAKSALDAGLLPSRAYCATVWALLLATLIGPYAFRLSLRCGPPLEGTAARGAPPAEAPIGVEWKRDQEAS